jgi:hypothetical protein
MHVDALTVEHYAFNRQRERSCERTADPQQHPRTASL